MAKQTVLRYSVPGDFGGPIVQRYSATSGSPFAPPGTSGSSARGGRLSPEDIAAIVELLQRLDVFEYMRKLMAREQGRGASLSASASTNPVKPSREQPGLAYSRHRGECERYSREAERLQGDRRPAAVDRLAYVKDQMRASYAKHAADVRPQAERALEYAKLHGTSYELACAAVGHVLDKGAVIG